VDVPVVAEKDFYPVYFSRGVQLEAALVARRLTETRAPSPLHRVVQVYRVGDEGETAARALQAIGVSGLEVVERSIPASGGRDNVAEALRGLGGGDAVMLWLRPEDLRALPAPPPGVGAVYVSGLVGGLERTPLPAAWRTVARLTYPVDLPEQRKVRMNFPLGWFNVRHIPVVAERVQADTYLACVILSETVGHMLDSFVPEYLVERLEALLGHRQVNGYYPRLALAPGQRFASKGGYVVRFADASGFRVLAEGGWTVP
jgi:hypothetical protein